MPYHIGGCARYCVICDAPSSTKSMHFHAGRHAGFELFGSAALDGLVPALHIYTADEFSFLYTDTAFLMYTCYIQGSSLYTFLTGSRWSVEGGKRGINCKLIYFIYNRQPERISSQLKWHFNHVGSYIKTERKGSAFLAFSCEMSTRWTHSCIQKF